MNEKEKVCKRCGKTYFSIGQCPYCGRYDTFSFTYLFYIVFSVFLTIMSVSLCLLNYTYCKRDVLNEYRYFWLLLFIWFVGMHNEHKILRLCCSLIMFVFALYSSSTGVAVAGDNPMVWETLLIYSKNVTVFCSVCYCITFVPNVLNFIIASLGTHK